MVNCVWYFISDILRPHLCKVRMHGCGVYEHWTHTQLVTAIDEQQFCERDAAWLSMEGEGPLASWGRLPLPHSGLARM